MAWFMAWFGGGIENWLIKLFACWSGRCVAWFMNWLKFGGGIDKSGGKEYTIGLRDVSIVIRSADLQYLQTTLYF